MSWERGRAEVERLIADGGLERVTPFDEVAARLLAEQNEAIYGRIDPSDQAVQGLRATTRGGHIAVIDAVRAQFNDRGGMEIFGRLHALRRRRNRTEYPTSTPRSQRGRRASSAGHRTGSDRCREAATRKRATGPIRVEPGRARDRSGLWSGDTKPSSVGGDEPVGCRLTRRDLDVEERDRGRRRVALDDGDEASQFVAVEVDRE